MLKKEYYHIYLNCFCDLIDAAYNNDLVMLSLKEKLLYLLVKRGVNNKFGKKNVYVPADDICCP